LPLEATAADFAVAALPLEVNFYERFSFLFLLLLLKLPSPFYFMNTTSVTAATATKYLEQPANDTKIQHRCLQYTGYNRFLVFALIWIKYAYRYCYRYISASMTFKIFHLNITILNNYLAVYI